jgi:two-component system, sensor histidine kinase LadS
VVEVVVLTFGLAYRFNSYRYERIQMLIKMNLQQTKYAQTIITAQNNERRQLADQLHDVAGSLLSAAKLNLSSVREKELIIDAEANQKLTRAEEAVTSIADMLRNLSHAISPVMLDKVGFRKSVERVVEIFNTPGKLQVELVIFGFEEEHANMREKYSILYGILYELMNNIVKHAQAKNALVQLIEHDDSISMIVEDNGKGLAANDMERHASHGLATIQSKIHYLQGSLMFDSAHPHGLILTIEIPKEKD